MGRMMTNSAKTKEENIMKITNAEAFKKLFKGLYATELWSWPEEKFLEWLNSDYTGPALQEPPTSASISSVIECLLHPQGADDSDMSKAIDTAIHAIKLLQDREPRVMTLEEVQRWSDPMWIEGGRAGSSWGMMPKTFGGVVIEFVTDSVYTLCSAFAISEYGKTWRCWTSRPSDAQKEKTPWT